MQGGKRELHLGLDPSGTHNTAMRRPLGHVLQERRLADARLPPQHNRPTLAPNDSLDQTAKHLAFPPSALELPGTSVEGTSGHGRGRDVTRADR
jgi:hypothetical protein